MKRPKLILIKNFHRPKMLSFFKTIKFQTPNQCDLILWDGVRKEYLDEAVLNGIPYFTIYTRREKYYFSFKIFFYMLKNILHFRLGHKAIIYYLALIEIIKPKVVLTWIYTNTTFDKLGMIYKEAPFLCIQNGTITHFDLSVLTQRNFQHYFTLSRDQGNLFLQHQSTIQHQYPIGSFVASYYKEKIAPQIQDKKKSYDLAIISQYNEDILFNSDFEELKKAFEINYRLIKQLIQDCPHLKATLIIRERENINEKIFFENIFGNLVEFNYPKSKYWSYQIIEQSRITIAYDSTLSLETIQLGEKLLYLNCFNSNKHKVFDDWKYSFFKDDYVQFKKFFIDFLNLPLHQYHEYLQTLYDQGLKNTSHLLIREKINHFLQQK